MRHIPRSLFTRLDREQDKLIRASMPRAAELERPRGYQEDQPGTIPTSAEQFTNLFPSLR